MHRIFAAVSLVLAFIAAPAAQAQDGSPIPAAPGVVEFTVDAGGRGLHAACAGGGAGQATVLLEPGGPFLDGGASIVAAAGADVAAALGARFCAYDRAGTGQSDPDPMGVRTFAEDAADLATILASPELACPCVVLGESMGGGIALMALTADASKFAGLVLLDSVYPGFLDELFALAPEGSPERALETDPYLNGDNEERVNQVAGFRQLVAPDTPPAIPIVVVTHGAGYPPPCNWEPGCSGAFPVEDYEAAWQEGQARLAETLGARLVVAENTSHEIAEENFDLVVSLTVEVIAAVEDPGAWATPVASTPAA